jgi:hypothetical protein
MSSGTSGFGVSFPLNLNQTPVSRAIGAGEVKTGAFFSPTPNPQNFNGAQNLVAGVSAQANASPMLLIGAAALGVALLLRMRK